MRHLELPTPVRLQRRRWEHYHREMLDRWTSLDFEDMRLLLALEHRYALNTLPYAGDSVRMLCDVTEAATELWEWCRHWYHDKDHVPVKGCGPGSVEEQVAFLRAAKSKRRAAS